MLPRNSLKKQSEMGKKAPNRDSLSATTATSQAFSSKQKDKYSNRNWREHAADLEEFVQRSAAPAQKTDVSDLPPELLKQLSVGLSDPLGAQLIEIFGDSGGCANLDQLLIGLYRRFQVIQNRRFLQNKIWRMVRKGQLRKADTRGMFCIAPVREKKRRGRKK